MLEQLAYTGTLKMRDMKMQDVKMWHKPAGWEMQERRKKKKKSLDCRMSNNFCRSTLRSN